MDETVDRISWGQTQWAQKYKNKNFISCYVRRMRTLRGSHVTTGEGCSMGTIKITVMDLIP
jgi:hypothetical protein